MANADYHHGNLKEYLVRIGEAELERIETPQMLSLREIAKRAGVSHNAPYRHFQSKDSLIEEILNRSLTELAEQILSAPLFYPASLLLQMQYVGRLWALLAYRHPQKTLLMFQHHHTQHQLTESNIAQILLESSRNDATLESQIGLSREEQAIQLSLLCMATLNGIALIVANDQIRAQKQSLSTHAEPSRSRFATDELVYNLTDEAMRRMLLNNVTHDQ
jgi:AcrR family transcriptional regulator